MGTFTAPLDLDGAPASPTACPACGAEPLHAVSDGDRTTFLCHACGRCWHQDLLWTSQVDPHACGTCTQQEAHLHHADRHR